MISPYEPPLTGLARLGYIVPRPQPPGDGARVAMAHVLHHLCPIPDPYDSSGAFARYHHADLPTMSLAELRHERRRVQHRLDIEERPSAWLWERLEAIRQALAMRRAPRPVPPPPRADEASAQDGDPPDPARPYHHPLPGLHTTLRGLHTTLRRL